MGDERGLRTGAGALVMTGLVVGTLVGFGAGFVVFGDGEGGSPGPARPPAVAGSPAPTEQKTPATPAPDAASEKDTPAPRPSRAESPASISTTPPGTTDNGSVEPAEKDGLDALRTALAEAIEAKDIRRLYDAAESLGASSSPGSRTLLIELLGDLELPLAASSHDFANWLRDTETKGIGSAARRRFDHCVSRGDIADYFVAGLLVLIARHGTSEDLEWLLARDESQEIREWAGRALRIAPRDEQDPFLRKHFSDDPWRPVFVELLRLPPGNREWIVPYYERIVRELVDGRAEPERLPLSQAMSRYGWTVSADELPEAEQFLRGLTDPWHRLAAASAVAGIARQGHDTSALKEFHDAAAVWLRQACASPAVDGSTNERVRSTLWLIKSHRTTLWNEETAAALEFAAEHLPGGPADEMELLARRIRSYVESEWK